jgi:threonine dehydrogenase-like Zn-dependent dehydrogenase
MGRNDRRRRSRPRDHLAIPRKLDAIVKITSTAICGSDLHLYNGFIPTMEPGDIFGHEFMGEVVEVGRGCQQPEASATASSCRSRSPAAHCFAVRASCTRCLRELEPERVDGREAVGLLPSGIFGYSHMLGGFAGGQAEYARVPFADVGPIKVPDGMPDEQVLFLSDIFPTGYMGAEMCDIKPGDTIAVWGCGPVGQFAIASAYLLGAERVIAIDRFPYRLRMAREKGPARDDQLRGAPTSTRRSWR